MFRVLDALDVDKWTVQDGLYLRYSAAHGRFEGAGVDEVLGSGVTLTPSSSSRNVIVAQNATTTPLTIEGAANQSADLGIYKDSNGGSLVRVTARGSILASGSITASGSLSVVQGADIWGGLSLRGTLDAKDAATVSGSLTAAGSLQVWGGANLLNNLIVQGSTNLNGLAAGATTLNSLTVTGAVSLPNLLITNLLLSTLQVTGSTNLNGLVAGATTLNSLTVTGATTLQSTLAVSGALTAAAALQVWGPLTAQSALTASGQIIGAGQLQLWGYANLFDNLTVSGTVLMNGAVGIGGPVLAGTQLTVRGQPGWTVMTLYASGGNAINSFGLVQQVAGSNALRWNWNNEWIWGTDINGTGSRDWYWYDNTVGHPNATRLFIKGNTDRYTPLIGIGTISPDAAVHIATTATLSGEVPQHVFHAGYSTLTNRNITMTEIVGASVRNYIMLMGCASGTTSVPTLVSTFASAFGFEGTDTSLSLVTATSASNGATPVRGLTMNNIGSVAISGALSTASTLQVWGASTLLSTLTTSGNITGVGQLQVWGAANFLNNLTVSGSMGVAGGATISAGLQVTSAIACSGRVTVGGTLFASGSVSAAGAVDIWGPLTAISTVMTSGQLTSAGALQVWGKASFLNDQATSGAFSVVGTSQHWGAATFLNTLVASGQITGVGQLQVWGATSLLNNLDVAGTAVASGQITGAGSIQVWGAANFLNNAAVSGVLAVGQQLTAQGSATTPSRFIADDASNNTRGFPLAVRHTLGGATGAIGIGAGIFFEAVSTTSAASINSLGSLGVDALQNGAGTQMGRFFIRAAVAGTNTDLAYLSNQDIRLGLQAPSGTTTRGLLNVGSGGFDGSASHFSGPLLGTLIAGNSAAGFGGDLINLQASGSMKVRVDALGAMTLVGAFTASGAISVVSSLDVWGTLTAVGSVVVTGGITVDKPSTINGTLTLGNNVTIAGTVVVGGTSASSKFHLKNPGASTIGMILQGSDNQTADLLQGQSGTSTNLIFFRLGASGNVSILSGGSNPALLVARVSVATGMYATVSVGGGGFTGGTNHFAGNAAGTQLGINATTSFTGDLINAQTSGSTRFMVDYTGTMAVAGSTYLGNNPMSGLLVLMRNPTDSAATGPLINLMSASDTNMVNAEQPDVWFNFGVSHKQLSGGVTLATWRSFLITGGQTFDTVASGTISAAATVHIFGAPVAGTNTTITNSAALWVQGAVVLGNNIVGTSKAGFTFAQGRNSLQTSAIYCQPANTGNSTVFMTAATESNAVLFDFRGGGNTTWLSGGFTIQREFFVKAPIYAANNTTAITNVATVAIDGAPGAGSNMTFTNAYALWIQNGGMAVSGLTILQSAVTVSGQLTAAGAMQVWGALTNLGAMTVSGAISAASTLDVWGTLTAVGSIVVTGGITVDKASTFTNNVTIGNNATIAGTLVIGGLSASAKFHLKGGAASTVGMIVQGADNQTADLFQGQSGTSTNLIFYRIGASGNVTIAAGGSNPALLITRTAVATGMYATLSLGGGGFTGGTNHFSGNALGTQLGINATTSFTGDLINAQVSGSTRLLLDYTGAMTVAGAVTHQAALTVSGQITGVGQAQIWGATNLLNNLTVSGSTGLGGGLTVYGGAQFTSAVSISGSTMMVVSDGLSGGVLTPILILRHELSPSGIAVQGLVGAPALQFQGMDAGGNVNILGEIYMGTNNATPGSIGSFFSFGTRLGSAGVENLRIRNTQVWCRQSLLVDGSATMAATSGTIMLAGATTASGTLMASGQVTAAGAVQVWGTLTNLATHVSSGAITAATTLQVWGAATAQSTLTASGHFTAGTTAQVWGNLTNLGTHVSSGAITGVGSLQIWGSTSLLSTLAVTSSLTAAGISNSGTYGGNGTAFSPKRFTMTFTATGDYTLAAGEKDALLIDIQTDSVLTATTNIIVPNTAPSMYIVINRNAQAIGFKTAAGTAINIASQRAAIVIAPGGTNMFRITPDTVYTV
jgi:hypothetical protein